MADDISQIGGSPDVQAAADNLQTQIPNASTYGQQVYEQYKKQLDMNLPGVPENERERQALEYASQSQDNHVANMGKEQAQAQQASLAQAAQLEQTNAMRLKLGMQPLPGAAPAQAAQPAPVPQTADFAQAPVSPPAQSPDTMASLQKEQMANIEKQKAALQSAADAGSIMGKHQAEQYRALAGSMKEDAVNDWAINMARDKKVSSYMEDIEKSQKDYQSFLASPEAKVKTNNLWENAGTGQKILAGISLALGALGAGNTGKNSAVDIIQNAISQDIDAQKTNIRLQAEGKLQNYSMANNLYAQMLKKYQNEDMATTATRLLRNQQVQLQVQALTADHMGAQTQAQAKLAQAQLDQSATQLKMQFAQAAQQKATFEALGVTPETLAVSTLPKELQEKHVPGYGFAGSKENAEKFQEDRARLETPIKNIDGILGQIKTLNRLKDPIKREQMITELGITSLGLIDALSKSKRFNADELHSIQDLMGNPASFTKFSSIQEAKLRKTREVLARELDDSAASKGLPRKNIQLHLKTLGKAN